MLAKASGKHSIMMFRLAFILAIFIGFTTDASIGQTYSDQNGLTGGQALTVKTPASSSTNGVLPTSSRNQTKNESSSIPWNIHFFAIPAADGTSLFISTGHTNELDASVSTELVVNGSPRRRFAMAYIIDQDAYEAAEVTIGSESTIQGTIALTVDEDDDGTPEMDTGPADFLRFFVRSDAPTTIRSDDIDVLIDANSLEADRSALLMDTNGPRGPLPVGYQLVWKPYTLRVSGADVVTDRPIELTMKFSDLTLGGIDPHTLIILQWDPVVLEWQDMGGTLFNVIGKSVVTQTRRFSDYSLASAPRWLDEFSDFSGLSERENVDILVGNGELILDGLSLTGNAISKPITPTIAPDQWGTLTYASTITEGTNLTIDILDIDNNELLGNVTSGIDLSDLDPAIHPSLKLRANFSTGDVTQIPSLDFWRLTWIVNQLVAVKVSTDMQAKSGGPGSVVSYTIEITNEGSSTDSFNISTASNRWPVQVLTDVGPLLPNTSINVPVSVTVPVSTTDGISDTVEVTVESRNDTHKSVVTSLTTTLNTFYGLSLSPRVSEKASTSGSVITHTLYVTNTGNISDTFSVLMSENLWSMETQEVIGPLSSGETLSVNVSVIVDKNAALGSSDTAIVTIRSQGNNRQADSATVVTRMEVSKLYLPLISP